VPDELDALSPADRAFLGLHAEGWSCGDAASAGPEGRLWVVYATREDRAIVAEGATRDDAWINAADQAHAG
jgi:hypothetical protein